MPYIIARLLRLCVSTRSSNRADPCLCAFRLKAIDAPMVLK